ncbi:MAG: CHAD domain-containing protein [Azospirillaceae bacterium]|nr:CHAD domain-containing protein [Azospirillaceae bacterium]
MTGSEVELKLTVASENLPTLSKAPVLKAGKPKVEHLESIYFDTADFRLRDRAITLRIRRRDDSFIQTLKTASRVAGPLAHRGEWESVVSSDRPDLAALPDGEARSLLGVITEAELVPVFESRIDRTVRLIDNRVEVAFDTGEIRATNGETEAVSEIELELKGGEPQHLFDIALELAKLTGVRVETRTKAERGYALLAGTRRGAVKASRLDIESDATGEQALELMVRDCLNHLLVNEACALQGEDAEGIHQMRVALRRLRSALVLFRRFIPAAHYDWVTTEVKWLATSLGAARDWDVFKSALLTPIQAALPGTPELDTLAAAAEQARLAAYDAARAAIVSNRYTILLLRLNAWLESRAWRDQRLSEESAQLFRPVRELADGLLAQRQRIACKRGRHFPHLRAEERHEVRKALKKLRYAIEFFQSLYDSKPMRRYLRPLETLQDDLGHLNDVATARLLIAKLDRTGADASTAASWWVGGGIVIGWHARGGATLGPEVNGHWDEFVAAKPFWTEPEPALA